MAIHFENDAAAVPITTTTETLVAFLSTAAEAIQWYPGEFPSPVPTRIFANVVLNPGTATTQATLRVRHGNGITGALIGQPEPVNTVAGVPAVLQMETIDNTGDLTGYSITIQQTAATANGTVNSYAVDLLDIVT